MESAVFCVGQLIVVINYSAVVDLEQHNIIIIIKDNLIIIMKDDFIFLCNSAFFINKNVTKSKY